MIQDLEFDIDLKHKTICKECCKQNDTLNLIFNVYDNGQAVDLTGFTAILNCNINNTNQVIKNSGILINGNKITIFDKEKYITTLGENVKFELVLSKGDVQKTSFNVSLEIEKSVLTTTGHLEEVTITALTNLQDQLNQASETIQKLETANNSVSDKIDKLTTENTKAQTNYDNLKNVNDNLSDLVEANTTATTNINNLTIENNKAAANIEAMQGFGDLTNLAQQVETNKNKIAEHTTQLNAMANNKANKNNSEFIGTMKLNNKDVATIEHFSPEIFNGWIFGFNSSDMYSPTKIIIGNVVVFTGLFCSGVVDFDTIICKLPKPAARNHFAIFSETGQPSRVYLASDGNLTVSSQIEANTCYMFTIIYEREAQ